MEKAGSISDPRRNNEGAQNRCMDGEKEGELRRYVTRRGHGVAGGRHCGTHRRGKEAGSLAAFGNRGKDSPLLPADCVLLLPAFRAIQPVLSHCSMLQHWVFSNPLYSDKR